MERKQLELSGVTRKRHTLDGGEPVISETATCRMVGDSLVLDVEALIGYSPWVSLSDEAPPCSGFWDIKDGHRRLGEVRALYNQERNFWTLPHWPFPMQPSGASWRGLKAPWPGHSLLDDDKPERRRAVIL